MLAPQQAVAPRTSSRIHRGGDGEDMGFDAEFHYLILVFGTMAPIAVPPWGNRATMSANIGILHKFL